MAEEVNEYTIRLSSTLGWAVMNKSTSIYKCIVEKKEDAIPDPLNENEIVVPIRVISEEDYKIMEECSNFYMTCGLTDTGDLNRLVRNARNSAGARGR